MLYSITQSVAPLHLPWPVYSSILKSPPLLHFTSSKWTLSISQFMSSMTLAEVGLFTLMRGYVVKCYCCKLVLVCYSWGAGNPDLWRAVPAAIYPHHEPAQDCEYIHAGCMLALCWTEHGLSHTQACTHTRTHTYKVTFTIIVLCS